LNSKIRYHTTYIYVASVDLRLISMANPIADPVANPMLDLFLS
jgi:hypothetical protein